MLRLFTVAGCVRFSGSVASCRMLWSVGCIIDMFESEFSVHTSPLLSQCLRVTL